MTQEGLFNLLTPSSAVTSITGVGPIQANGVSGVPQVGDVSVSILGSGYVASVTGTANRITASPTTGNVVVDIAATYVGQTSLTTLGTITTGTWHGSVIAGQYGGTGVANTGLTITLASGAVGKVLASDSSGNGTWQALSGLGVTSITGTANQVFANGTSGSAQTGAVTLTLPQNINTTASVQFGQVKINTTSTNAILNISQPTNGSLAVDILFSGANLQIFQSAGPIQAILTQGALLQVGTAQVQSTVLVTQGTSHLLCDVGTRGITIGSTFITSFSPPSNGLLVEGPIATGGSVVGTTVQLGVFSTTKGFLPPSMTTTQKNAISSPATGLVVYDNVINDPFFWNGSAWIGFSSSGVTSVTGTTNQITASPTTGAVVVSLTNGISIGSFQATTPPTGGIICPGNVGIGSTSLSATFNLLVDATSTSSSLGTWINIASQGTLITPSGGTGAGSLMGIYNVPAFNPTLGAGSCYGIYDVAFFMAPSTRTITNSYGVYINNTLSSNVGTLTNVYGLFIDSGSSGTGTISTVFGLNVKVPAAGTNRYTATFDPTVGIGANCPNTLNLYSVVAGTNVIANATFDGTFTGTNTVLSGIICSHTYQSTASLTFINNINSSPNVIAASGQTIGQVNCITTNPVLSSNVGTINTFIEVFVSGGASSSGTVSSAYGLYVSTPQYGTDRQSAHLDGNTGFFTSGTFAAKFAGGVKVIAIGNRATAPTGTPVGGGILYANAGAGTWKGTSGTVTTFGPADPHCPECGSDFGFQWENPQYGGQMQICARCLFEELGDRPYVRWNKHPVEGKYLDSDDIPEGMEILTSYKPINFTPVKGKRFVPNITETANESI